jgi:hypothetical protein
MKQIFFVLSLAALVSSCSGTTPVTSPIAPSLPTPSAPVSTQGTYTLSGVISEVTPGGRVPVAGVLVEEVLCDAACAKPSQTVTTDANGSYRMSEFPARQARWVWLSKKGYKADEFLVTVTEDTRLDIDLVKQ